MKKLIIRAVSGLLFLAVVIGAILYHPYTFLILFGLACVGSVWEFYQAIDPKKSLQQGVGTGLATLTYLLIALYLIGHVSSLYLWGLPALLTLPFIIELFRNRQKPFSNISLTVTPYIYVVGLVTTLLLVAFNEGEYHPYFLLGIFALVWIYDTMAYVIGRFLGKHKLFERISPKKTWEGTVGGGLCTLIGAYLLAQHLLLISLFDWQVLGFIIIIAGNFGDLIISMIKREYNKDDTGNLIPGHGGFLDRFDALFFVMPFVYAYLTIFAG